MKTTPGSSFISIAYVSLLAATIVAAVVTTSASVLVGGLVGTVVITKLLAKGI